MYTTFGLFSLKGVYTYAGSGGWGGSQIQLKPSNSITHAQRRHCIASSMLKESLPACRGPELLPCINSLAPGKFQWHFRYLIFRTISVIDGWGISWELVLRWMSLDLTDDKSTLVPVMAWCRQATSHYLSQWWPRPLSPCGITRPQWVNFQLHTIQHGLMISHPCYISYGLDNSLAPYYYYINKLRISTNCMPLLPFVKYLSVNKLKISTNIYFASMSTNWSSFQSC